MEVCINSEHILFCTCMHLEAFIAAELLPEAK